MISPAPGNASLGAVSVTPKNAHKNMGSTLLSSPDSTVFALGWCCPKIQKKVQNGSEGFKLDFLEFGALGGKLILIPYLF
jgi:hypothetical protein